MSPPSAPARPRPPAMGAAIHLHRRRILFGWMTCLVVALIVKFRQDWISLSSYSDATRHMRNYQLKIPYEQFFYAEDSSSNSTSSESLSSAEVAVVLPEALERATFHGCCAVGFERKPQFDRDPWKATCHTEQACSNETLYPFSSAEEAAFLAKWKPLDVEVKRFHRESCKAAADQLQLEATWCHPAATAVATTNHQNNNATPTAATTNIPEAVYPMGCSLYSMGGGSGPYDRLIVFPLAKLAFCGIPKAGITRWIQFLRFTLGAKDYQDPPYSKADHMPFYFDQLRPKVQWEIWNDPSWTRAVLIREPTERLLSAYLDKVAPQSKIHGNLTFAEFVGLLRQTPTTRENKTSGTSNSLIGGLGWYSDPHWRPQSYSCGLAQLLPQFQHVGGLDRVAEHTKAILQSVGLWETHGQHYRLSQNKTKKIRTEPPEPLEPGQVALGFQQESLVSDHHSRGAQAKIDEYYTPELLEQVKKLYQDDYALWEALQVAGPQGKVHGKDIAAILNPSCAND